MHWEMKKNNLTCFILILTLLQWSETKSSVSEMCLYSCPKESYQNQSQLIVFHAFVHSFNATSGKKSPKESLLLRCLTYKKQPPETQPGICWNDAPCILCFYVLLQVLELGNGGQQRIMEHRDKLCPFLVKLGSPGLVAERNGLDVMDLILSRLGSINYLV